MEKSNGEVKRPFRLYNATNKENLRWRCYLHLRNAHIGALVECRWSNVGVTIEVVDVRTGRMLGQYTRSVNTVKFLK